MHWTAEDAPLIPAGTGLHCVVATPCRLISDTNFQIASHAVRNLPVWRPFPAPAHERIIVAGWQPPHNNVRGYWWVHEDDSDINGRPSEFTDARYWQSWPKPPEGLPV